jgi:hypothetical protein
VLMKDSQPLSEAKCNRSNDAPLWVALAVVQSDNARRQAPISSMSIPDLELCLSKASAETRRNVLAGGRRQKVNEDSPFPNTRTLPLTGILGSVRLQRPSIYSIPSTRD